MLRKFTISILIFTAYYFVCADNALIYAMAKVGYAQAQYDLGAQYHHGTGVTQDYKQAFFWYTKAAEQDHDNAQIGLAEMYYNGEGVVKNYNEAFSWYTKSAEQNNAVAQRSLAGMYNDGEGVTANNQLAIMWITKAAENGDALAQVLLATAYATGEGLTQNWKKAYIWFSVYAVTNPSPIHLNDVSPHLTPAEIEEARASAAALIKKIEVNKAHKK